MLKERRRQAKKYKEVLSEETRKMRKVEFPPTPSAPTPLRTSQMWPGIPSLRVPEVIESYSALV